MKALETIVLSGGVMPTLYVPEEVGGYRYDSSMSSDGEPLLPLPKEKVPYLIQAGETAEISFSCSELDGLLFRSVYAVTTDKIPITRSYVYVTPIDNPSLFQLQLFEDGYKRSTPYVITPLMFKHFPELQKEIEQGLITVSENKDK